MFRSVKYKNDETQILKTTTKERLPKGRLCLRFQALSEGRQCQRISLAIVRQIAVAHGWEVGVTEGEEGGARFEVRDVEKERG